MLRRWTAVLLMLCLTLFSGEALVADVHDGDATAAELQRDAAAHRDAPHADRHVAQSEVAATTSGGDTGGTVPGQPVHSVHLCHCLHAHGLAQSATLSPNAPDTLQLTAPAAYALRMPPSLEREPQLRPPIAA